MGTPQTRMNEISRILSNLNDGDPLFAAAADPVKGQAGGDAVLRRANT